MSEFRRRASIGLGPGDTFTATRAFDAEQVEAFARMTCDYNPIHFDAHFARLKGFDGPICHGLLTGSLITLIGGQIAWLASRIELTFLRPVPIGETVECSLTVLSVTEQRFARAQARITNSRGEEVVRATLEGFLPSECERTRLAAMIAEGDPTNGLHGCSTFDET